MGKLKLRLEELRVESFATAAGEGGRSGTVRGHAAAAGTYDLKCVTNGWTEVFEICVPSYDTKCEETLKGDTCEVTGCASCKETCDSCRDTPCVSGYYTCLSGGDVCCA